jgi:ComF family protein
VAAGEVLCRRCAADMDEIGRCAYCPTCARTVPPFAVANGRCGQCRDHPRKVIGMVRVGPYEEPLRAVLHAFKYRRDWALASVLARRLSAEMKQRPWFGAVDALAVVPGWWPRQLGTRYYAPGVLAPRVSRETGVPLAPLLRRVKGSRSQIGLTAAQRVENVRGKFALTRGVGFRGATLCLIDDVMTTGATLEECAKVLVRAGARAVYGAVVAQVGHDSPIAR